jgi:hypothetical protein
VVSCGRITPSLYGDKATAAIRFLRSNVRPGPANRWW